MSALAPLNGGLLIRFVLSRDIRGQKHEAVYASVEFDKKTYVIKGAVDSRKNPNWDDTIKIILRDCMLDTTVKIQILSRGRLFTKVLGAIEMPVFVLLSNPKGWLPFYKTTKHKVRVGEVFMEVSYEGDGGLPQLQPSRYGLVEARYGIASCDIDVISLLQMKIHNGKLRIPQNVSLRSYIGIDPLKNHNEKTLKISYLQDGKKKIVVLPEALRDTETVIQFEEFEHPYKLPLAAIDRAKSTRAKALDEEIEKVSAEAKALTSQNSKKKTPRSRRSKSILMREEQKEGGLESDKARAWSHHSAVSRISARSPAPRLH